MRIEQAIFTSAKTARGAGYQLVARSPGVLEEESRELAVWGPSHGALWEERDENSSVNFNRLESGKYCISKTTAAGQEFSGRGGARIYTQFFIVPAEVLAKFSNNPFAILRAAWAKGLLTVHDEIPNTLEAFSLVGRTAAVDEGLLGQLADQWGPQNVGRMIAAAMGERPTLFAGTRHNETLIGGLLNCFPAECRTELSFTTGLRFSPRRPFRMSPADSDVAAQRRAARQGEVYLVDLSDEEQIDGSFEGWAQFVAEAILSDQLPLLTAQLQVQRPGLQMSELNALGEALVAEMHAAAIPMRAAEQENGPFQKGEGGGRSSRQFRRDTPIVRSCDKADVRNEPADSTRRVGRRKSDRAAQARPKFHTIDHPEVVELFEQLDDAVYDVISGKPEAANVVLALWSKISSHLDADQLAATREQYLRYTLTLWDANVNEGVREPGRAVRALDVLTVLFAG